MRKQGRKSTIVIASAVLATMARTRHSEGAAPQYSYSGGTYTPNFSELPFNSTEIAPTTDATSPDTLVHAFSSYGNSTIGPDFNGWQVYAQTALKTAVGPPNTTTGGVFSFGSSSSNQSLGAISTSSTGLEYFGVEVQNTSGSSINQLKLTFNDNLWWSGALKPLDFGYYVDTANPATDTLATVVGSTGGTGSLTLDAKLASNSNTATNATNAGSFTSAQSGTQVGGTTGPLANETLSDTLSLSTPLAAGGSVWFVWYTDSSTSKSQGIGMNSLSFSTDLGGGGGPPPPSTQTDVWSIGAGTGAWETTLQNWTISGTSTATNYSETRANSTPDAVVFPDTLSGGSGTINITAGSVSPSSITVQNNDGTYNLIGNPITGSTSLLKTGFGTLALLPTTSNGYTGGTIIQGGQIVIAADAALGAPTGGVTLNGGTLTATSPITSARALVIGANGGALNLGANAGTFGAVSGSGAFSKLGSGNLTVTGAFTSGPLSVSGGNLNFTGTGSASLAAVTINPGNGTLSLPGNVILSGPVDFSVAGASSTNFSNGLAGAGSILVQATNTAIHNLKATDATINNNIVLNSNDSLGQNFTAGDVTQSPFVGGNFVTVLGGGTAGSGLTVAGQVSGFSDVVITNDAKSGGGSGVMYLNTAATYRGTTVINMGKGQIVSGVDNALPVSTNVIIGGSTSGVDNLNGNTNGGIVGACSMDLAGHRQQFSSISDGDAYIVGGSQAGAFSIINSSGTTATLTVSGSTSPATFWSAGAIGGGATGNNINLVKGGTNSLVLDNTSTYTGTTTIQGGTLSIGSSNDVGASSPVNESIASANISLHGIDSKATLVLYSSTALANGGTTIIAVTTAGSGASIGLNFAGQQVINQLIIDGVPVPNGVYSASQEPATDNTLLFGGGSLSVVPEPGVTGLLALATPVLLRRRRKSASQAV